MFAIRGSERYQQPAVLVVGGEQVDLHLLLGAGGSAERQALVELPHAPLERGRDRARGRSRLVAVEVERLLEVMTHELALGVAGQLKNTAATARMRPVRSQTTKPVVGAG